MQNAVIYSCCVFYNQNICLDLTPELEITESSRKSLEYSNDFSG